MLSTHIKKTQQVAHKGSPAWILTFADLMSLLMALFILMFALSEVDKTKYKSLASAMRSSFGGKVPPANKNAKIENPDALLKEIKDGKVVPSSTQQKPAGLPINVVLKAPPTKDERVRQLQSTAQDVEKLRQLLKKDLIDEKIQIEQRGQIIIVRILDEVTFARGSSTLLPRSYPVLDSILYNLGQIKGAVLVASYTDSTPTSGNRSSWELTAARAYAVGKFFLDNGLDPERLTLQSFGSTHFLVKNDTPEHMALNRRIEVSIDQRETPQKVNWQAFRYKNVSDRDIDTMLNAPPVANNRAAPKPTVSKPIAPAVSVIPSVPQPKTKLAPAPAKITVPEKSSITPKKQ